jgi:hypothetical protein
MQREKYPQLADKAWLEYHYLAQGLSCAEIATIVGCGKGSVEYRLHGHGIPVRGRYPGKWKPKTCAREGCGRTFTPEGPAQKFCSLECRPDTRICEGCGAQFRPKPPQHRSGKGGSHSVYPQKFCSFECRQAAWAQQSRDRQADPTLYRRVNANGYVEVNIGARNGGRVLEHRWVMERMLGRKLFASEDVHHKNGDKTDNSEPNLELWTRSQPRGQRVVDKIEWAIAFLAEYGYRVSAL